LQTITVPNNSSSYNSSFYVRKQSGFLVFVVLFANGTSVGSAIHFNKATGQYQSVNSSFGFSGVATNIAVEDLGDYFKFSYALANNSTGNTALRLEIQPHRGTSLGNLSQTNGSAIIWGAQLVEGTDAKPYFATTNRQDVPRLDYRNADGSLNSCPRLLLEPQRTNSIRNSTMVGAVAGSPGNLPTNYTASSGTLGLTRTIVGTGTESGLTYLEVRFNGTASSTGNTRIAFEATTGIAALVGQSWSLTTYAKIVSSPNAPNSLALVITERNSAGSGLIEGTSTIVPTSSLQRFTFTRTNTAATCAFVEPLISFALTNGAAYDFTIRIAAPQMELGAYATTYIPTTTAAVTRLADIFTRTDVYTNNFITAAGGTWFLDLSNNLSLIRDNSSGALWIGDNSTFGSVSNGFTLRHLGGTTALRVVKILSGSGTVIYTTNTDNCKIAIRWNDTTAAVFVNGSKVVTATPFTTTNMEFLANMTNQVPYYFNQSALFPVPMTDAQLAEITTL
jgi:hypothetical protein